MDEIRTGALAGARTGEFQAHRVGNPRWAFSVLVDAEFRSAPESLQRANMFRLGMTKFNGKQRQTGRRLPVRMFSEHHWPLPVKTHLTELSHEKVRLFRLSALATEVCAKLAA